MASANQRPMLWNKRSVKHEKKFQKFQNIQPPYVLENIGSYFVCKHNDFKISDETNNGTCVYIGLGMDGKEVAVKCMLTDLCQPLAMNESKIYGLIKMGQSPHVARYLSYHPGPKGIFTYIVLELCEYSLVEYVRSARHDDHQLNYDPPKIIKGILTGLQELHKRGFRDEEMILHRDLKPENVLFDVQDCVRLADFGVSKHIGRGRTTVYTSGKGNTEWQAAESIPNSVNDMENNVVYKRKSDVQVAGMLAFYVITKGEHPFGRVSYERAKNIVEGRPVGLDALTDPVEKDFVTWLIEKNIDDRPFADEALKHPYLLPPDQQLEFLAAVGNENEVATNTSCDVVNELNAHSMSYPNGWKGMIPDEIVRAFSQQRDQYHNNITSLLRFMRNVNNHFNDQRKPERIRQVMKEPAQYLLQRDRYFIIPMLVHSILRKQAKTIAQNGESMESAWVNRRSLKSFF